MSIFTVSDGILNVNATIQQNGQAVAVKDQIITLSEYKIKASATINAMRVVALTGFDVGTNLVTGATLSSLSQTVLGINVNSLANSNVGNIVAKGILPTSLNGTGQIVGDSVYATALGDLSFTVSSRRIGSLLTATLNAVILVDIREENSVYAASALSIPAGVVMPFTGASSPTGFLLCDGASYLTATYPNLFAVTSYTYGGSGGNFNVPDYRGMFLRGTGTHGTLAKAAGGNFSGPSLGGSQLDQGQGHYHNYIIDGGTGTAVVTGNALGIYSQPSGTGISAGGSISIQSPITDGTNGTPRTGNETRPASWGVSYIIKV